MGYLPSGTTAMAVITVDGVHLLSDTRQVITPPHSPHLRLVTSDVHNKLYDIGGEMAATAAGTTDIILKFLEVVKVAVNNVSVDAHFAATILILSIDQWMFENPGSESPAEFIIGSCHGGQCIIHKVRSTSLGGIEEENRIGHPVFLGSGSNYASWLYGSNLLGIDPISLAEACIVTAALKCPSTGGKVKKVQIPLAGPLVFHPEFPMLKLMDKEFGHYGGQLSSSVFLVCDLMYNEQNENALLYFLGNIPGASTCHVIHFFGPRTVRIVTFTDVQSAEAAWEGEVIQAGSQVCNFIGPMNQLVNLRFLKPRKQNIKDLAQLS